MFFMRRSTLKLWRATILLLIVCTLVICLSGCTQWLDVQVTNYFSFPVHVIAISGETREDEGVVQPGQTKTFEQSCPPKEAVYKLDIQDDHGTVPLPLSVSGRSAFWPALLVSRTESYLTTRGFWRSAERTRRNLDLIESFPAGN